MPSKILHLLCSSIKLERDQAISELSKTLPASNENIVQEFKEALIDALNGSETSWENKYGCLLGAKIVIGHINVDNDYDKIFISKYKDRAMQYLVDDEPRVRMAAGTLLKLVNLIGKKLIFNIIVRVVFILRSK